jgi:hypothetical protein
MRITPGAEALEMPRRSAGMLGSRCPDGHGADPLPGGVEDRVGDGRRDGDDGGFAGACGLEILAVEQDHICFGNVPEAGHTVSRESRVGQPPLSELNLLAQRRAEAHHDAAFHLSAQVGGVQDRPAFEGLDNLDQPRRTALPVHVHLNAGCHHGVLLGAAGQADTGAGPALLPPFRPAEPLSGRDQDVLDPLVIQVREPELERVLARRLGQFVGEGLAGEVVGRRRKAPLCPA